MVRLRYWAAAILLICHPISALDLRNSHLQLICPDRGQVEVDFHLYGHVSELWGNQFFIGKNVQKSGSIQIVTFTNNDQLFYDSGDNTFGFKYIERRHITLCQLKRKSSTKSIDLHRVPAYSSENNN